MQVYYSSVCHVCKKISNNLKRCSSCKHIAYCSKEHQSMDWPYHKKLCKAIVHSNKTVKYELNCSPGEWRNYRLKLQEDWEAQLGRKLLPFECQMWMFPRVCAVCYSKENLVDCQKCFNVAYCSKKHQQGHYPIHKHHCKELELSMLLDLKLFAGCDIKVQLKDKLDDNVNILPGNLSSFCCFVFENYNQMDYLDRVIVNDMFSYIATILFALESAGLVKARKGIKEEICIHIAGADKTENSLDWEVFVRLCFMWIKNLTGLHIILVGPDLNNVIVTMDNINLNATVKCYGSFYHDIIAVLPQPDIVMVFNAGLHEFTNTANDTWALSIPKLVKFKYVPLVLTAYTENELELDLERFAGNTLCMVIAPKKNPFSCLKPIRDWDSENLFYINNYIAVISQKESKVP